MDPGRPSNSCAPSYQPLPPTYQQLPIQYRISPYYNYLWHGSPSPPGFYPSHLLENQIRSASDPRLLLQQTHRQQHQSSAPFGHDTAFPGHVTASVQPSQGRTKPLVQPGEDLMTFEDSPILHAREPAISQQAQSSPAQPTVTEASSATMQQAASYDPSTNRQDDDIQRRIDDIVNQSLLKSHQDSSNTTQNLQHPVPLQASSNTDSSSSQPVGYTECYVPQRPDRPLLFHQAAAFYKNQSRSVPSSNGHRTTPNIQPHQQAEIDKEWKLHVSNLTASASAQSINEQKNAVHHTRTPTVLQERHGAERVPNLIILSNPPSVSDNPSKEQPVGATVDHTSQTNVSLSLSRHSGPLSFGQFLAMTTVSAAPSSSGQVNQKFRKTTQRSGPSPRGGRNNRRGRNTQKASPKSKDSARSNTKLLAPQACKSQSQSVEANPRRVVRTAIFNTETGEVKPEPAEDKIKSDVSPIKEGQGFHSQDTPVSGTRSGKTSSNGSNGSTQDGTRSAAISAPERRVIKNSTERLLSAEELFKNRNVTDIQPVTGPSLSATHVDRPLTLRELMQRRDAAASSSSVEKSKWEPRKLVEHGILMSIRSQSSEKKVDTDAVGSVEAQPIPSSQVNNEDRKNVSTSVLAMIEDKISETQKVNLESGGLLALPTIREDLAPPSPQADIKSGNSQASNGTDTTSAINSQLPGAPRVFTCQFCPDEYRTAEARKRHEAVCRRRTAWPKNCCFCGRVLKDRQALSGHADNCGKTYKGPPHDPILATSIRLKNALKVPQKYEAKPPAIRVDENAVPATDNTTQEATQPTTEPRLAASPATDPPPKPRRGRTRGCRGHGKGKQSATSGQQPSTNQARAPQRQRAPAKPAATGPPAATASQVASSSTLTSLATSNTATSGSTQESGQLTMQAQAGNTYRPRRRGGRRARPAKKTQAA